MKLTQSSTQHLMHSCEHQQFVHENKTNTCMHILYPSSPQLPPLNVLSTLKYAQPDIEKVLVGNKCDLTEQRAVTEDEAKEYAKALGVPFLQTSSKAGTNIDEVSNMKWAS